jgi:hypothetical protein
MRFSNAVRLVLIAVIAAGAMSVPMPAGAVPIGPFQIENWYYSCGTPSLVIPKGYEITDCEGYYYSEGNVTPAQGDFRHWRMENCSTGVVRERWYIWCGTGWTALSGPPSSGYCYC